MTRRRKSKIGGAREGAGRPCLAPGEARSVTRSVKLTPGEAKRHDTARGDVDWAEWIREAAELAIARGSTR